MKKLAEFIDLARKKGGRRIVVASAEDEAVLIALKKAKALNIAIPILTGNKDKITKLLNKIHLDSNEVEIFDEPDPSKSVTKAIDIIRHHKADILMKGMISTGTLLKAVLSKDHGLREHTVLSHIAFFESPYYHKLLCITDAAMNIAPDLKEKVSIINNAILAYHKLNLPNPKVAAVCAIEGINPQMEATMHASMLTMMNRRNQITGCVLDGPLALDNAISREAADHKHIQSEVSGDVDIILTPDINSGNILYKSLNFIGGATSAAVIMGARVPIILTSRADSEHSKLMSIALAAAMDV